MTNRLTPRKGIDVETIQPDFGKEAVVGEPGVLAELVAILEDLTSDWDTGFSGSIGPETSLIAELGFESIDVVHLIVTLEERFERQDLPFESLLMRGGRYVSDLSVGDLSGFLETHLAA